MPDKDDDKSAETESDPRLAFLSEYVLKTLKQKPDKWSKMLSSDENRMVITTFFERADAQSLVFHLSAQGQLTPSPHFPSATKFKSVYFVKKSPSSVTEQNARKLLVFGDLSHTPLDQLSTLVDDVRPFHSVAMAQIQCSSKRRHIRCYGSRKTVVLTFFP